MSLSNETLLAAIVVGVATTVVAASYASRKKKQTSWPHVPGALPIIGNFHQIGAPTNIVNKLNEWADLYGKERGVFQCNIMGIPYVVVCREDTTMQVLSQRPFKVTRNKMLCASVNSCKAVGLFSSEGDSWKADRRLVAPALNHKQVREYFDSVKVVANRLVDKWTTLSAGGSSSITINRDCYQVSMDIIAMVILGADFDTLRRSRDTQEARDIEKIGDVLLQRSLAPFRYFDIPLIGQYLDGGARPIKRLHQSLDRLVEEEEKKSDAESSATFLSKVVKINKKDEAKLSRDRMIGNLITMFFGGTDTSGSTLTTALYVIATDTNGLQDELAAEAKLIKNPETITWDEILEALPRQRSFYYELQRHYSPAAFLILHCEEQIPFLDDTTLPEGTQIMALTQYTGLNPHSPPKGVMLGPNGEGPSQYCPRRWLTTKDGKLTVEAPPTTGCEFLTFGHGMRMCPGKTFAHSTFLFIFSSILAKFKVELEPGHPPVGRMNQFVDRPNRDVKVIFTPRE
jgi:cytochrome P450